MSSLHHLHPTASNHLTVVILTSPELVVAQNRSNCNFVYSDGGVVVLLGFYVSPTAKVIRRRYLGLKSHHKDLFIQKTEV